MTSVSLSAKYLCSSRLHCVDCVIAGDRLEAGWVYSDGYLAPVETLDDGYGNTVAIEIPEDIQALTQPTTFSYANEPVEFWRAGHAPKPD